MKRITTVLFCLISAGLFTACDDEVPNLTEGEPKAVIPDTLVAEAILYQIGQSENIARGKAVFWTTDSIVVNLKFSVNHDWLGGRYMAIHIHEGGTENPGMHFNAGLPMDQKACNTISLNEPWGKPYIGDAGNLRTNDNGIGEFEISTELWSIHNTKLANSIVNRAIVLHYRPSDFELECDPTHVPDHNHSNPKYAMGNIALVGIKTTNN